MTTELTRRSFIRKTGGAAVGAGLAAAGSLSGQESNDKIRLGFIGVAGRGSALLRAFMNNKDVEVAAICDVYEPHREKAIQAAGGKAKGYNDYRKMLEDKDIDGVVIATPTHWHALNCIHACQAGKDVYCEKPLAHNIVEGRAMVKAARANKRVVQMGTQIHAEQNYRTVVEKVRTGAFGKITIVRLWLTVNEAPLGVGKPRDEDPPKGLDWDMWLGPAPKTPYNQVKFRVGRFRYFWDYAGGWMTAMGPHIFDMPYWALNLEGPTAVCASGGRYATDDIAETPDTQHVLYEFPGMTMIWSHSSACSYGFEMQGKDNKEQRRLGIMFHGTNGSIVTNYGHHEVYPEGDRMRGEIKIEKPTLPPTPGHYREWLDCIRSRALPSCDVEYGHRVTAACHLGNIATRVGRRITFDPKTEQIIGDKEASALLGREYRAPWVLPT